MSIPIKLSDRSSRELDSAVQKLIQISKGSAESILKSQARLFCVDLAIATRRTGKGVEPARKQKESIQKTIEHIYWPVGKMVNALKAEGKPEIARQFQRYLRKREYERAAAMLTRVMKGGRWRVGAFDGGELHRKNRFRKTVTTRMVVVDKASISRYITEVKKRVGVAKGGFATAAKQLGGSRGIPAYAANHNAAGSGRVTRSNNGVNVEVANNVRYAELAIDPGLEQIALNFRIKKITETVRHKTEYKMKQASRSLK